MTPVELRSRGPRAGRRRLELGGPLLMGILNATPDSFSDGGRWAEPGERSRSRARWWRRARTSSTSAASRRAATARRSRPEGDRARRAARRARLAEHDVLVSVDTYKPEVAEAAIAAGAAIVNDVSGLRDPALAEVCAATGAALVLMHTRGGAEGHAARPGAYERRRGRRRGLPARADGARARAPACRGAAGARPGPDFAKTPAQTVAVLRRLASCRAPWAARCCWPSRARTSSARSPAARRRSGCGHAGGARVWRRRGRADPARARRRGGGGLPRVRAVLRGERLPPAAAGRGPAPGRAR